VGGLGLFIARRVIEAHGGRIWADSNGHGSVFRIQVPATQ
jgi:signal transduction histidine kinase